MVNLLSTTWKRAAVPTGSIDKSCEGFLWQVSHHSRMVMVMVMVMVKTWR